jgi:polyhydroxybutyrate depolymerase
MSEPLTQKQPVSALIIACIDDPFVPIDGGTVKDIWSRAEIQRPSVRLSVEKYAALMNCSLRPVTKQLGEDVLQLTYGSGRENSEVVFYTIADAGHVYPGGPRLLSERIAGKPTDALNATDVIWEFFKSRQCQL